MYSKYSEHHRATESCWTTPIPQSRNKCKNHCFLTWFAVISTLGDKGDPNTSNDPVIVIVLINWFTWGTVEVPASTGRSCASSSSKHAKSALFFPRDFWSLKRSNYEVDNTLDLDIVALAPHSWGALERGSMVEYGPNGPYTPSKRTPAPYMDLKIW